MDELLTWNIDGQARVSAPFPVRVTTGDPNYFLSLINSNYLQVGSLRVNGQWVYGDLIDLEIISSNSLPHIISKPNSPYVIETTTNLPNWIPTLTNSSPVGLFDLMGYDRFDPQSASTTLAALGWLPVSPGL